MQVHEADAAFDVHVRIECGSCVHYLKRKCPRHYDGDTELWRRQDTCEIFKPTQNVDSKVSKTRRPQRGKLLMGG